jgi:uncharacterized protein
MKRALEFVIGLLFGLGLLLSGMTDPARVLAFLDLAGAWDPSLLMMMAGGVAVASLAFAVARRRTRTFLGDTLNWPQAGGIDRRLVTGSLVFGIGWGLSGFCPGPALVSVAAGHWQAAVFMASMLAGMALHDRPRA